jgi:hypothetical protein
VGDVQIKITEEFLSQATGLPLNGKKWFKNSKLEEVPWSLFFTSRKIQCCDKGMPISLLKTRWHGLLAILRQFITCEGRFRPRFSLPHKIVNEFHRFPVEHAILLIEKFI